MIIKFKLFEVQTRNSNITIKLDRNKENPDIDMLNKLSGEISYKSEDFKRDVPFIDRIRIYQQNGIKMLSLKWNHSDIHDFKKRLRERTQIRSVSEFNDFFEKVIKYIFSRKLIKVKYVVDCALHLINSDYNIIIRFNNLDYENENKKNITIIVKTVVYLPRKFDLMVNINEEEFV